MKKVISIAVSTLLLSNISFADTTNADNGLLQSIQQKIDTKKSNLGSNVQANSGLSGFNKTPVSNAIEINKELTKTVEPVTPSLKSNNEIPKVEVNKEVKEVNKELTKPNDSIVKKEEFCEPKKPIVKKIVKKPIKKQVKVVKKQVKNEFEFSKTQNYIPVDFSSKQNFISKEQVKLNIQDNLNVLDVTISDDNGQVIPKEQFNKSFIRVVQVSQNFNTITHQENEMNFSTTTSLFKKNLENCGAIFVQYELKSSTSPISLVKYVDKNGLLSNNIDNSCVSKLPKDLPTNLNYSASNNLSSLFFKNYKLVANQPIDFSILFLKNGLSRTPKDLFVYILKQDFSDLNVIEPKSFGNAVNGVSFEHTLAKGNYILGYSFNEGATETYFKNLNVE